MSGPDLSHGLEEQAALIFFYVGGWHEFGYENPPTPDCKTIPPLGERSAHAIEDGHKAVKEIDELIRQMHGLRAQLVAELRQNEDAVMARSEALLARLRDERPGEESGQ